MIPIKLKKTYVPLIILTVLALLISIGVTQVLPAIKYNLALNYLNEENHEESLAVFKEISDYKDSGEKIAEIKEAIKSKGYEPVYLEGVKLAEEGRQSEAVKLFAELGDYKDSFNYIKSYNESCFDRSPEISDLNEGDTFVFGSYEQDGNSETGTEPIEWIILDKQDDRALAISLYTLSNIPYNGEYTDTVWETSSLRENLNNKFINDVFTAYQQEFILTSALSTKDNEAYSTDGGADTNDKIFVLSIEEAEKYFPDYSKRSAFATKASSNGHNTEAYWWLRSPGSAQNHAAYVAINGNIITTGNVVTNANCAIRPAMWIKLK